MKTAIYKIITGKPQGVGQHCLGMILAGCSLVYRAAMSVRTWLFNCGFFKSYALGRPVISVGNLTWGGVGKTPLVVWIAQNLETQNRVSAILMRGYAPSKETQYSGNDEALMLNECLKNTPILVGKDRVLNAKDFLKKNDCDVFIMDDGYQHLRVHRQLNILAIDATNPFGNGWIIPRGILREPKSALKRADLIVLTKVDLGAAQLPYIYGVCQRFAPQIPVVESYHQPVNFTDFHSHAKVDLLEVRDRVIMTLSSIGNPQSLKASLEKLGAKIKESMVFRDHHAYSEKDIFKIIALCESMKIKTIVTTHKDAVKLKEFKEKFSDDIQIYILNIQIEVSKGKEVLLERIAYLS